VNSSQKIGAFFDLDGTLVAPPSLEWQFIGYLLGREAMGGKEIGRWLARCAKDFLRDPRAAASGNKQYLAGLRESLVKDWAASLAPDSLQLFPAGVERVAWHFAQGHRVFLISGTLKPLAHVAARRLPWPVEICTTELEARHGFWTGQLVGEHVSGEAKARAIREFATRYGLALWDSFAYGNSIMDLPMLDSVGHRLAINPPSRLRRIARTEGWQSCDWAKLAAIEATTATTAKVRARPLAPKEAR
jgi:HAD superfamily hydrolase (TIGR01490 family)